MKHKLPNLCANKKDQQILSVQMNFSLFANWRQKKTVEVIKIHKPPLKVSHAWLKFIFIDENDQSKKNQLPKIRKKWIKNSICWFNDLDSSKAGKREEIDMTNFKLRKDFTFGGEPNLLTFAWRWIQRKKHSISFSLSLFLKAYSNSAIRNLKTWRSFYVFEWRPLWRKLINSANFPFESHLNMLEMYVTNLI